MRIPIWLARFVSWLGFEVDIYLECRRCGREFSWQYVEAHEKYFHSREEV